MSNCQCGYIESFFEYCGYERFFTDYLCWGDTGKPKSVTIKRLMEKNRCRSAVYVGDTQGDLSAATDAGIPFVHAAYSFGKVSSPEKAVGRADKFSDLIRIAESFGTE